MVKKQAYNSCIVFFRQMFRLICACKQQLCKNPCNHTAKHSKHLILHINVRFCGFKIVFEHLFLFLIIASHEDDVAISIKTTFSDLGLLYPQSLQKRILAMAVNYTEFIDSHIGDNKEYIFFIFAILIIYLLGLCKD